MAIQTLNTIKNWFKTGSKPSQDQFWDTWDSFRHKYEKVPIKDIEELETTLDTKAEKSQLDDHKNDQIAHAGLFSGKEDKYQKGVAGGYVPLDEFSKITHQYLNLINNLTAGGENSILSAEQGVVLQNQIDNINRLLKCDNVDLDTVQKIVDAVTQIQTSIDTILVNDLTTGGITKALTAEMGKILELNKEDKSQKGIPNGYAPLDEFSKIAHQYLSIVNNLTAGGATASLSAEQGVVLQSQIDDILTVLSSDNINLDTIQEIVDAIETVQVSLSSILVNDLTTGGVTKALTAEMGKTLDLNKEDKSQKGLANGYAPLDSLTKLASQYLYIVNDLITGGATSILSAEQGKLLQNQINGINTLLSSDNIDLDTIQEIVDAIENVESYLSTILVNDLKTGGVAKALTAEMGKQLDQIKLTATLATDAETQTTVSVAEDNKVVSRSKLFNWWESIKSQAQTIKAVWNFSQGILIPNGVLTTVPQNGAIERDSNGLLWETHNGIRSQITKIPNLQTVFDQSLKETSSNSVYAQVQNGSSHNSSRIDICAEISGSVATLESNSTEGKIVIGGKAGKLWIRQSSYLGKITLLSMEEPIAEYPGANILVPAKPLKPGNAPYLFAIKDDFLSTPAGTTTTPPLIIPKGELTTVPQKGAIERDTQGNLYHTPVLRERLLDTRDVGNFLATTWRSTSVENASLSGVTVNSTSVKAALLPSTALGSSDSGCYLFKTFDRYVIKNGSYSPTLKAPSSLLFEVYLKGNNCKFSGNQYVRLYSVLRSDTATPSSVRNYEIPMQCSKCQSAYFFSQLTYSEQGFDNFGNIISDTYREYNLQSLSYAGAVSVGDMKLSDASISLEYRVSVIFEDAINANSQNADARPIYSNYSSLFIKL